MRAYDPNLNQWTTPDAYSGDVHDPMSQHPYMWNSNNPVQYQDPTGYDPYLILDPSSALGLGHIEIAIIDHDTGKGILWSQGPEHDNAFSDREVITKQAVTLADLLKLDLPMLTEQTTTKQDNAMNAVASARYDKQSQTRYNADTNNCDQFTRGVLGAADPKAARLMDGTPNNDFIRLMVRSQMIRADSGFVGENGDGGGFSGAGSFVATTSANMPGGPPR